MLFASVLVRDRRAPIPKTLSRICLTYLPSLKLLSAAAAAQLALFALIHQLIASHQDLNRIPGILCVGVGVGAGAGVLAGLLADAVRRRSS